MNPVITDDGLTLHLRVWPAGDPRRGVVVLVHGLGEHIDRYDHVARRLNGLGFAVVGYDHRGHGRSPGPRGGMPTDDALCADLGRVLYAAREAFPGPLVLLGHSLGGLIAGRFVAEGLQPTPARWWRPVDALVLSSPALDPGTNAVQKLLLAVVAPMLPDLAVNNGLKVDWISRDPDVVKAYAADPLVHDRITGRLGLFVARQGPAVIAAAPQLEDAHAADVGRRRPLRRARRQRRVRGRRAARRRDGARVAGPVPRDLQRAASRARCWTSLDRLAGARACRRRLRRRRCAATASALS